VFEERDEQGNIVIFNKRTQKRERFELLNIIEFSSSRKRMSVVIRNDEDKIICLTKGADSIMLPLLRGGQDKLVAKTIEDLDSYANEGLRTLLIAEKEVDPKFY